MQNKVSSPSPQVSIHLNVFKSVYYDLVNFLEYQKLLKVSQASAEQIDSDGSEQHLYLKEDGLFTILKRDLAKLPILYHVRIHLL